MYSRSFHPLHNHNTIATVLPSRPQPSDLILISLQRDDGVPSSSFLAGWWSGPPTPMVIIRIYEGETRRGETDEKRR